MEKEIIFEHPRLTLTHYPKESCILESWNGFTTFELFAELLDKTIKFMIEKNAKNLILDVREHKGLNPKGNEHGARVCIEHAQQYGKMKHAIVIPSYLFSQMSVDNFERNVKTNKGNELVENRHFQSIEDALAWMQE
jgi:hypothetical protein